MFLKKNVLQHSAMNQTRMKKKLLIMGSCVLLLCIGFSGCNTISNLFLSDEDKFLGSWDTQGLVIEIEFPTVITFYTNNSFKLEIETPPYHLSLDDGEWTLNNGVVTMELTDALDRTEYTYKFTDDNTKLTLTNKITDESFVLTKQQVT
jgi:hypothetical protein